MRGDRSAKLKRYQTHRIGQRGKGGITDLEVEQEDRIEHAKIRGKPWKKKKTDGVKTGVLGSGGGVVGQASSLPHSGRFLIVHSPVSCILYSVFCVKRMD